MCTHMATKYVSFLGHTVCYKWYEWKPEHSETSRTHMFTLYFITSVEFMLHITHCLDREPGPSTTKLLVLSP